MLLYYTNIDYYSIITFIIYILFENFVSLLKLFVSISFVLLFLINLIYYINTRYYKMLNTDIGPK